MGISCWLESFTFFRNHNFLKILAMITKPHVANVSTVWELLPLLPTTRMASRVHLERKSRKPKKERDNTLITPKDPSNTTVSQTSSNTSINKGLTIKRPSFLSWKKGFVQLSTASIELVQKLFF